MQCKMMDLRAPCMDPEFQGMGQDPGNVPEFTIGSCNQEERLPAFALGRITGSPAGCLLSHGEVLCTSSIKRKGTAVHMQMLHHPLRGGQASGSEAGQLPHSSCSWLGRYPQSPDLSCFHPGLQHRGEEGGVREAVREARVGMCS